MFGDSNIYGSSKSLGNLLGEAIICEYCGQKYTDLVSKYTHQIYYCMGRDLSLEASLLRIRNNLSLSALPSYSYLNRLGGSSVVRKYPLYSLNDPKEAAKSIFVHDGETKSEGAYKLPKITDKQSNKSSRPSTKNGTNTEKSKSSTTPKSTPNSKSTKRKSISMSSKSSAALPASNLRVHAIRLRPNQDLNHELDKYVKENDLKAAFIMTCVGSLTRATLRMAYSGQEQNEVKVFKEHLEIVSLVGTLSSVGGHHLHISLSDKDGHVFGGHVFGELNVFTTAEIVIGECLDMNFTREFDNQSGFDELVVNRKTH